MTDLGVVTFSLLDSFGRITKRSYQARVADPATADIQSLAAALAAITRLGVISAQKTVPIDISAQATSPTDEASRQNDARLECYKSLLRDSRGGTYTFNLPHPKPVLINTDGTLNVSDAAFGNFVELFDDGAGVAGVVGQFFVSDGEELVEGALDHSDTIKRGFLYKD